MGKAKTRDATQFAAIPFAIGADGCPRVLLLTSRETRRWVIPKGWPIHGLKPREVAAREAFEEAGVLGSIVGNRVGSYHYCKQLPGDEDLLCRVNVFLLQVERQAEAWPEQGQRDIRWVAPAEAAEMVLEGGLSEILRRLVPGTGRGR